MYVSGYPADAMKCIRPWNLTKIKWVRTGTNVAWLCVMATDQDREDDVWEGKEEGRQETGEPGVNVEQGVDADVVLGVGAEV